MRKNVWLTSTRCEAGACVEVMKRVENGVVTYLLRDGKVRGGPVLSFTPDEWDAFRASVRLGEFA